MKKIISLIVAMLMVVSMFGTIAYAAEGEKEFDRGMQSIHFHDTINAGQINWAQSAFILNGEQMRDYIYVQITAPSSPSTHRMSVKPYFRIYSGDSNQSYIKLDITIVGTGTNILSASATNNLIYVYPQSSWFSVSPGQTVTLKLDVSTYYPSQSTGTYRYADFMYFEIYSDW